ncbi:HxlR family transcriptional regulator [Thermosporothrix hazakensis]|jgi:DNA-binding HxlR family transcriptional regulator|uniref:HxlR family transcriptional regulator n=2 Tax=Thermosporothrix TaxID=768650 RepID=A0A326UAW5_THEHA|nr:helix-turn-helix domain-containing protein [Thermosporothrix hazakensis]PZW34341.1 HxlR family transcriptional regulator [Thermosporothrix hazakensis]BBH85463.1 transcriptional regulator [Thermosporothrix sp. COM3]GCE46110.1 transcriptional regulator [Thermosporothrix hazakensis]
MVTFNDSKPTIDVLCPTRRGLSLLSNQWTLLVLGALHKGTLRFSELQTIIEGISKKMLTQTLRDLERNGLIKRVVYPVIPPMVEYSLTPLGETIIEPIWAFRDWSEEHIEEVERAREEYDRRSRLPLQEQTAALVQQRAHEASEL